MAVIELDFSGAPPAQGGGSDLIPAGRYVVKLADMRKQTSGTGTDMIVVVWDVASGEQMGKQVQDRFSLAPNKDGGPGFGVRRFHACLVALGAPVAQGRVKFESDKLLGKACEAQVGDKTIPASGEYEARVVSEPRAYHPLGSAKASATKAPAAAPAAPKAAPAAPKAPPAPVAVVEEVTLDVAEATDISDEVDDLFA